MLVGLMIVGGYRLLEHGNPDWRWQELKVLPLALPGIVGGAILGTRHLGALGFLLGPMGGLIAAIALYLFVRWDLGCLGRSSARSCPPWAG